MDQTLKKILMKYAERDLAIARKNGVLLVTNTNFGDVEIKYRDRQYMIVDFNNAYSAGGYAHYVGLKSGAADWLFNHYRAIHG